MGTPSLLPASLEQFLQATSDREQVVTTNMANVDTPGYRTKDVRFHELLMSSEPSGEAQLSPVVSAVHGLLQRPDGNNVDLDRESMLLARTQLQYQMGTQLVKDRFHQLLSAINGGS
jgi:flagellar basal-body rod protein FlgB